MSASSGRPERHALKARVVCQFREPSGAVGRLAGWLMAHRPSNKLRNARTLELLALRPDDTVLEIGYGPGYAVELACSQLGDGRLFGIDHSPVMHAQATRRNAAAIATGRASLLIGDVLSLGSELPAFDKIYSVNVVQFWPNPAGVFDKLQQLLKPGGIIATTFMPRVGDDKQGQAKTKAEMLESILQNAGFERVEEHWLIEGPAPAFCLLAR